MIKQIIKQFITSKEKINSLLIAILCMSGLISLISKIDNIIPIILLLVLIAVEIINYKETLKRIKDKKTKIRECAFIFVTVVMLMFLISIIHKGLKTTIIERLLYFIGFICIPYLCCRHEIKIKNIINSILVVSGILATPLFFMKLGNYNFGTRMAISYYMLPTYIAMIMTFFLDENKTLKRNIGKVLLFLTLFYPYIDFLINYASRGIFVSLAVCVFLCAIAKKELKTKIKIILITLLLIIVMLVFLKPILNIANTVLGVFNINIDAISKNLELIEQGNIDNGRNKVFDRAIEGIKAHPFIGNGIGDYAEKYVTYPHNFLLQAWYEGGIIFFALMLTVFLYSIYILLFDKNVDLDRKYMLILFFSISIVRLMLSYEFWREISFGMYLYFVLDIMQENWNRRKKQNGNSNNTNI